MRKQFHDLVSLEDARGTVASLPLPEATEPVPTREALGRVLAGTVAAGVDVPGFDRSTMDGYAVRAADTAGAYDDDPVPLAVVGSITPGRRPAVTVGEGEAAEIATGAVLPEGADAVVKVEVTERDGDRVLVRRPVAPRDAVMARGADIAAGDVVVRRGERLDPRHVGLLSAVGAEEAVVRRRPTVGVVSTGAEIVRPEAADDLAPGEIFDINTNALASAAEAAGGTARVFPHAEDDYAVIRDTIVGAAEAADVVVSTGSTSASAEDVVYRVVEDAGTLLEHGIAIKPGKPTVIGRIDGTPVFGLPGNPISALMTFQLFVAPLLRSAAGREEGRSRLEATLATHVESVEGRTQLLPVGLVEGPNGGHLAYDVERGSAAISSVADADGYLTIPRDTNYLESATAVEVTLLDDAVVPPAVLIGGETCPAVDRLLEAHGARVRHLDDGTVTGVRRLRDGVLDVAIGDLSSVDPSAADRAGVDRRRGYERRVGLAVAGPPPEGDFDGALRSVDRVGTTPPETGLRRRLDALVADLDGPPTLVTYPSVGSARRALSSADVDAVFGPQLAFDGRDVGFVPGPWQPIDLLVATERLAKPALGAFLGDLTAFDFDRLAGVRRPDDVGATMGRT